MIEKQVKMQEIAPNVHIETSYPGVTLGLISRPRGVILIDAPFRVDDIRLWRASIHELAAGAERLLINLDEHFDRTLGSRQIECTVVGQERLTQYLKDRPINIRPQGIETGAEWELHSSIGNVRWSTPEITFNEHMEIYWGDNPLLLDSRPGPSAAAIWVTLPVEKIIFIGDAVMLGTPPFLANANLAAWIEMLSVLLKPNVRQYTLLSGRGGVIDSGMIKNQVKQLEKIQKLVDKISGKPLRTEDIQKTANQILKHCTYPKQRELQYQQRLQWGLSQYLRHQSLPQTEPVESV